MSTFDTSTLRAEEMTARAEARRALEALNKVGPNDRAQAMQHVDAALIEHARARVRAERADDVIHGGGALGRVTKEPPVYGPGSGNSWFRDLRDAQRGVKGALERINRNARELRGEGRITAVEQRAVSEEAASGGALVAPAFLQKMFVRAVRTDRPYVAAMFNGPLPDHTDLVKIPDLNEGGTTGAQADLGELSTAGSVTTSELESKVVTIPGSLVVARQLFDRAAPALADHIFFPDLTASYLATSDVQAITGSGVSPNALGVLNTEHITKITYTEASPKLGGLLLAIADAYAETWTERKKPPTICVMHPRRWAYILKSLDAQERPIVPIHAFLPAHGEGIESEGDVATVVGQIGSLRVVVDPNIPTNKGAGTNQDVVIVQRAEDSWYLENDTIHTQVAEDQEGSKELALRLNMWAYAAIFHQRYPKGICVIEGNGLVAPTL
jgi:HK97 family phage major capsid protein